MIYAPYIFQAEEILDLSRLERQRTGLERPVFDLDHLVEQALTK